MNNLLIKKTIKSRIKLNHGESNLIIKSSSFGNGDKPRWGFKKQKKKSPKQI